MTSKKDLGPLTQLVGTWTNAPGVSGFNLIAVPNANPSGFNLVTNEYVETIVFKELTADVPNRGGVHQQNITGLTYDLVVSKNTGDPEDPANIIHVENGMFLYQKDVTTQPADMGVNYNTPIVPATDPDSPQFLIARQASIPHGNVILAQGNEVEVGHVGVPDFSKLAINPIGKPLGVLDYALNYPNNGGGGHQTPITDLNQFLRDHISEQKQTLGKVVTFKVDTDNKGSISSIPFVQSKVVPSRFSATFWIEEVLHEDGTLKNLQLQYSQVTLLAFDKVAHSETLVIWPHGNANTMIKTSDETHHRALDAHKVHCWRR